MNTNGQTRRPVSAPEVIVGKLTEIEDGQIKVGAGATIRVPDQRLLDGIEVGMRLTLVVTRQGGQRVAERIVRFDEDDLRIVAPEPHAHDLQAGA